MKSKRIAAALVSLAMAMPIGTIPCQVATSAFASYNDTLMITAQPSTQKCELNADAKFSVITNLDNNSGNVTYQWQYSSNGGQAWANSSTGNPKTKELTVKAEARRNNYQYRCIVSNGSTSITSLPASLVIVDDADDLAFTAEPADLYVDVDDTVYFPVVVKGSNLAFQWQYSSNGGRSWGNSSNGNPKTNILTVKAEARRDNYMYRCVVTDGINTITSRAAALHIVEAQTELSIKKQPESIQAERDETVEFEIVAEGEDVTYQWQYSSNGGTSWANSTTGNPRTNKLSVKAEARRNGYKYRCIVSDGTTTLESDPATLTIETKEEFNITSQPENVTAKNNDNVEFSIATNGENVTYQWQYSSNGGTSWANSTTGNPKTSTLTVKAENRRNGYKYRCIVSDGTNTLQSEPATLTVENKEEFKITSQPENVTKKLNENAEFNIATNGENVTYQWQWRSSANGTWADSTTGNPKTDTLTVKAENKRNGYQYRCIVSDGTTTLESEVATLTVDKPLTISDLPSLTVLEKSETTLTITATSSQPITYQWQVADPATGSGEALNWKNIKGETESTYTFVPALADNGKLYRCIVSDTDETLNSSVCTLIVEEIDAVIENGTEEVTINKGDTYPLPLKGKGLTYYSNNKELATVDSNGVVTTNKNGEGTVYVFVLDTSGHKYFYKIHVVDPYEALAFDEDVFNVRPDVAVRLYTNKRARYVVTDEDKASVWWDYDWYYDNSWVDFTGYVPGTYNVIAYTDDGEMTFCTVNVEGDVTEAELNKSYSGTLEVGDAYSDKYYGSNTWYRYTNNTDSEVMVTFDTTQTQSNNNTANSSYTLYSKGRYANSDWRAANDMVNAQIYLAPGEEVYVRPQLNDRMTSVYNFTFNATPYNPVDYTVGQTISNVTLDRKDYTEYVFTAGEAGEYELTANSRINFNWQLDDPENNINAIQSGSENNAVMKVFNLIPGHQYTLRFTPNNKNDEGILTFSLSKAQDAIVDATVNTEYNNDILRAYNTRYYKFELGDPEINNLLDVYEFTQTDIDGVSYEVLSSDMYTPYENIHSSTNGRRLYIEEPTTIYVKVTNNSSSARVPELILRKYGRNMTTVNSESSGTKNITANNVQWYEFTAPSNGNYRFYFLSLNHEISVNYEIYFGEGLDYSREYSAYNDSYDWNGYYDEDGNYQEVHGYLNNLNRNFVLREGEKVAIKVTGDFNADNLSTVIPYNWSVSCEESYPSVELALDTPTAGATVNGQKTYFEFTAPKAGVYYFWSQTRARMYGDLYTDLGGDWLAGSEGGGQFGNFCLQYHLKAGQKVVLCPRQYDNNDVEYEIVVSLTNSSDDWTPTYDHKALTLNTETAGIYNNYYSYDTFSFTASKAGTYVFSVYDEDYDLDAELYSDASLRNKIAYYYDNNEVIMEYELAKGQTVYLKPYHNYYDEPAEYVVKVVKKQVNNADILNAHTYEEQQVSAFVENWYKFTAPFDGEICYYFNFNASTYMNAKAYTKNQDGTYSELGYEINGTSYDGINILLNKGETIYIKANPYYSYDEVEYTLTVSENIYCNGHEVYIPEEYYPDYNNMYLDYSNEWIKIYNPAQNLYSLNIEVTEDHSDGYRNLSAELYTEDGTLIATGTSVNNVINFENPFDNAAIGDNTGFYLKLVEANEWYIGNVTVSYEPVVYEEGSSD